ncbi:MAG TPA: DUF1572 domain-containing protein [Phaeodactylibacter sp.]|nr:DUF1572 domain-containing protein [Phaeodactylibacter sp.]
MKNNYLVSTRKQFEYYKMLGNRTFAQLSEDDFFWQFNQESNSIAIIVKHLWGNMLSRWTDFLTTDGEKEWRNREAEFDADIKDVKELLEKWEEGWACLFAAIDTVNEGNFETQIFIRNQAHTVLEAMNRQMAHYAYHVGQIVFLGRMRKGKEWKSLSIARGKSKEFNQKKFSEKTRNDHFTTEFLNDEI